jgi:hypothetical protein
MATISAWINPLRCLAIDLPQAGPPDAEKLLWNDGATAFRSPAP